MDESLSRLKLAVDIRIFLKAKERHGTINKMETGREIVSTERKITRPVHTSLLLEVLGALFTLRGECNV